MYTTLIDTGVLPSGNRYLLWRDVGGYKFAEWSQSAPARVHVSIAEVMEKITDLADLL